MMESKKAQWGTPAMPGGRADVDVASRSDRWERQGRFSGNNKERGEYQLRKNGGTPLHKKGG